MVYKNANGKTESKRIVKKVAPKYAKHNSAKPYIRRTIKKLTQMEIENFMSA